MNGRQVRQPGSQRRLGVVRISRLRSIGWPRNRPGTVSGMTQLVRLPNPRDERAASAVPSRRVQVPSPGFGPGRYWDPGAPGEAVRGDAENLGDRIEILSRARGCWGRVASFPGPPGHFSWSGYGMGEGFGRDAKGPSDHHLGDQAAGTV